MNYVHSPVLVEEVLTYLIGENDKLFLDCTIGEGGHSEAVLNRYKDIAVYGVDRDPEILSAARNRLSVFGDRLKLVNSNFSLLKKDFFDLGGGDFDSALIDLGVSVYHYKKSGKGFSLFEDENLDMRLSNEGASASDAVNGLSEKELTDIFFKFGEEKFSRIIARKIVEERAQAEITNSKKLAEIIASAIPKKFHNKRIHPATKVFQAIRIYVNNEFENIETGIPVVFSLLKKGGKLGVITFHSLEDRIVKNIFQEMSKSCVCPPKFPVCVCGKVQTAKIVGKALTPSDEEINNNPPSRSARMRIVEKLI